MPTSKSSSPDFTPELERQRDGGAAAVRFRARIVVLVFGALDAGVFWHTDIYEVRDGRWQAVWSQATRMPATTPDVG